ncbi:MAG: LysM peptidoglycan-binding domain-containing protein, partial [Deltaproteobacteria bacterium]|nr:LysM peptidoglycan-binding domain-containing protein [Deltaproteobacteria bacterium]
MDEEIFEARSLNFAEPVESFVSSEVEENSWQGFEGENSPAVELASITQRSADTDFEAEYEGWAIPEELNESGSEYANISPEKKDADLWDRIRAGFTLPDKKHRRIDGEARWFSRNQDYLDRVADQARPYLHYIVSQVEQRGLPTEIVLLPVVESAFQPYAYSPGHAAGIWQFIPSTGRRFGLKLNWWYDGRRDIVASTRAALDYLEYLNEFFDGDWLLALAAYNSGEGKVLKAMRFNRRRRRPTDFWSLRLPRETQQYVPRLLALRNIVAAPEKMGITLKPIPDEPYLTTVDIDSQLDLATAAKLADMDLDEFHQLNPGFNRWATAPDGPHSLLLPLDKAEHFAAQVAQLPPELRIQWVRHRIRRGETLGGLALRYQTTPRVLRQLNNLNGNLIRTGHYLVIPIPARVEGSQQYPYQEIAGSEDHSIHTVRSGENLWILARRYGTTVRQLCVWNNISPRSLLQPGQPIIVARGPSTKHLPATLVSFTGPDRVAKPRKLTYRVRRGDSL